MHLLATLLFLFTLTGCQSTYYATMEQVGIHKREIMADRVEAASQAQQEAIQQFSSALNAMQSLTQFKGSELEELYNNIHTQYEDSEDAVKSVSKRIHAVKDVSEALFFEWKEELLLYSSPKLRSNSKAKLLKTQQNYQKMLNAMENAEKQMHLVLNTLRDNSLYLKHNLNATAIGALKNEFSELKLNIDLAIKNMKTAIAQSESFLVSLKT